MLSLVILDHVGWWTILGNFLKYFLICIVVICGVTLFTKSRGYYFGLGWLFIVPAPLLVISIVEKAFGPQSIFSRPSHEDVFIYVWLFTALVEIFLVWIPLLTWFYGVLREPFVEVQSPKMTEQNQNSRGT